ncbi:hypothetical protein PPYR_15104 [Photinus pyralis]|uniref:DUF4218 domain-containing protein n=2 Tax=Photinus pyralis TaxID=7054 RepID=A0A1Y1NHD9_PHOPY|nr:uncharacterized protein LOC116181958 isoform X1 [Photinus pyralis]KAB0790497.1 hypothetical protein PPYR_15104 [Photinus pyralis]
MSERRKYKVKAFVGKRQLFRRIAKTVRETLNGTTSLVNNTNEPITLQYINNTLGLPEPRCEHLEINVSNNSSEINTSDVNTTCNEFPVPLNVITFNNTSTSQLSVELSLISKLRQWCVAYNSSHASVTSLLHILHSYHPELPLTAKALLKTPRRLHTKPLGRGEFYYMGIAKSVKCVLSSFQQIVHTQIEISFNIDGLPIFNSSSQQFWPILGLIKNIKSKPFAVAIFSGTSKPQPIELFLDDFVIELNLLLKEGLVHNGKKYDVVVHSFVCDAPARAFVKSIKTHSGYSSCEKCTDTGEYVEGRVVFRNFSAQKRTDSNFISQLDEDHHIGISPLVKLEIGMVTLFPLDYMHCCCLGVTRKLLCFWMKGNLATRLSNHQVQTISKCILSLKSHIPFEFNRKPRVLGEVQRWKATEFRTFLLYLGAFVLKKRINTAIYEHFLIFHVAISILASRKLISKFGCAYANELLLVFVKHAEKLYGKQFLVYNIHSLLHLADDVMKYGPLDTFSCFPFENFLGQIKRLIRSPTNTLQQACRRLYEIQQLRNIASIPEKMNCHYVEHDLGPLPEVFRTVTCMQFSKYNQGNFIICTYSYSSANSYVLTNERKLLQVENIIVIKNETFIVGKYFQAYDSLYKYPLDSNTLDIYVISHLSPSLHVCCATELVAKCLVFPIEEGVKVSFPIIHSYEEVDA